jgi:membrane-associated phospholipid phosphatase
MTIKTPLYKQAIQITLYLWIAALISILWIDKPLALNIHKWQLDKLHFLSYITEVFPIIITIIVIISIIVTYLPKIKLYSILIVGYFYLSLSISMTIKTTLKILFGRYWPKTWFNNNLSLIHDGVFGFDWLHGFHNYGSFPSGHSTYIAFCAIWLVAISCKLRYLGYLCLILVPIALIMLDYHFLGDCLAGLGLGYICAYISLVLLSRILKKIHS